MFGQVMIPGFPSPEDGARRSDRRVGAAVTTEARRSGSGSPADAARLARAIRGHRGIADRLHRLLAVALGVPPVTNNRDHFAGVDDLLVLSDTAPST